MAAASGTGYLPDPYDRRDRSTVELGFGASPSLEQIGVEAHAMDPLDQGATNACTFFAVGDAIDTASRAKGLISSPRIDEERSSKQAGYAWGRHQHSNPQRPLIDAGSYCRSAVKGAVKHGICRENTYPWNPNEMVDWFGPDGAQKKIRAINARPPLSAFRHAFDRRGPAGYYRVFQYGKALLDELDRGLASGFPFVCGTAIDDQIRHPGDVAIYPTDFKQVGMHAMEFIARKFFDGRRFYLCQQSYGWRMWLDERYITKGRDHWIIDP